jgi:hypothetical protein
MYQNLYESYRLVQIESFAKSFESLRIVELLKSFVSCGLKILIFDNSILFRFTEDI